MNALGPVMASMNYEQGGSFHTLVHFDSVDSLADTMDLQKANSMNQELRIIQYFILIVYQGIMSTSNEPATTLLLSITGVYSVVFDGSSRNPPIVLIAIMILAVAPRSSSSLASL